MGCDIHCYIEYGGREDSDCRGFGGCINPGRNYTIFGYLAGVRGEGRPVVSPRGVPSQMGYVAIMDNQLSIRDSPGTIDSEGYVTPEKAAEWVKDGSSTYLLRDDKPYAVTHPDHHTHSWVTPDEWEEAIRLTHREDNYSLPEYEAILAILHSFEAQGFKARVVFWFDN